MGRESLPLPRARGPAAVTPSMARRRCLARKTGAAPHVVKSSALSYPVLAATSYSFVILAAHRGAILRADDQPAHEVGFLPGDGFGDVALDLRGDVGRS